MEVPHSQRAPREGAAAGGCAAPSACSDGVPDIRRRTFDFAARIVRLVRSLPRDHAGIVVARQPARCGTGIAANIEEAQGAHSRKDFARRMRIARTEAGEALYWLRLLGEAGILDDERLTAVVQEADEIVRILVAIVKRLADDTENRRPAAVPP